jgi:hypothetical protein
MTPRQKALARHALGLPNRRNRSYRNRFICTYAPGDYDIWIDMLEAGLADAMPLRSSDRNRFFWLTLKGAAAALDPGETLDPEDFPTPPMTPVIDRGMHE